MSSPVPEDHDLFGEDMVSEDHTAEAEMEEDGFQDDEARIAHMLNDTEGKNTISLEGPIDQRDKADDAVDYENEDFSDGDLPDEEEPTKSDNGHDVPGLTDDQGTNDTDIWGEDDDNLSLNFENPDHALQTLPESEDLDPAVQYRSPIEIARNVNFDPEPEPMTREQIIAKAKELCPKFEPGVAPYMLEWFPFMKANYRLRKEIPKPPRPLTHPKISLEVAPDQERAFRSAGPAFTSNRTQRIREAEAKGIVLDLSESEEEEEEDAFDYTPLKENQVLSRSGVTVSQLRNGLSATFSLLEPLQTQEEKKKTVEDVWLAEYGGQPRKKQKVNYGEYLDRPVYPVPNFNNFEQLTAQIGRGPVFDLNDPNLLVTTIEEKPQNKRLLNGILKRGAKKPPSRYNISNDEITDALKASNQSKIRAAIGNITVEHSIPAIKCTWPYYKVKRSIFELRAAHRIPIKFNKINVTLPFSKPNIRKKKHLKALSTQQIYAASKDLSLGDNSSAMLLEYSEENPPVLSNFGMGNRIINYYRRANDDDSYRPKLDVGETQILQPTDESPYNKFGSVEPGQTVPTLHNSMYRAPVFRHEPRPHDFLIVRATTGVGGSDWYLRKIDHVYTVGQEFPSIEVPGPHSRKVTTSARSRMMMLAYRMMNKGSKREVKVSDITKHIYGSNDMQNRQKLKEFLKYDKDAKVWKLKDGQNLLDEPGIRNLIKPEDVCLIDAMQVGVRQLEDAGFDQTIAQPEVEIADDDKPEVFTINSLAPWKTTKAFLEASSGKAMLELKGEGDLSVCGMHLSFIKTSMKGGFMQKILAGPQATSADAMEKQRKANGGHDYNVSIQEAKYAQVLNETWKKQREILSDPVEHIEMDEEDEQEEAVAQTPGYAPTPSQFDDSVSQTGGDAPGGKLLRIVRTTVNRLGDSVTTTEIVRNPRVAMAYLRRRRAREAEEIDVYEITNIDQQDYTIKAAAKIELARLLRNKERREHRERMKARNQSAGNGENNSPVTPGPSDVGVMNGKQLGANGKKVKTLPGMTARKCANCGMSGHIRTNRARCPVLNGQWPDGTRPADWVPEISTRGGGPGEASGSIDTPATFGSQAGSPAATPTVSRMQSPIADGAMQEVLSPVIDFFDGGADDYVKDEGEGDEEMDLGFEMEMEMGMGMGMDMGVVGDEGGDEDEGMVINGGGDEVEGMVMNGGGDDMGFDT